MDTEVAKPKWWRRFTDKTGLYGLELVLAVFGLLTIVGVTTYGLFLVGNYIDGIDSIAARVTGEVSIWIVAIMLVWLPVTLLLYSRTSREHVANPLRQNSTFYKVIISTYKFLLIITAIGLLFAAVYSLMRLALDVNADVKEILLSVTLPAFLSAAVNIGFLFVYTRSHRPIRRVVVPAIACLSLAVMVTLFVFAVGVVRTASQDSQKESDITAIVSAVAIYYDKNREVPTSLSELDNLDSDVKSRLDAYTYKQDSNVTYQLCADFLTDTRYAGYSPVRDLEYVVYAESSYHAKGEHCYKLTPTYDYKGESKVKDLPLDESTEESTLFN